MTQVAQNKIGIVLSFFICFIFSASYANIDSLRAVLSQNPDNAFILNELASALIPDSIYVARPLAERAYELAEKGNNLNEQARALYAIGDTWWWEQDYATAIGWFERAALIYLRIDNYLEAASCYNDMGYSCVEIDRFDDALRNYKKSLQLLLKIDDEDNIPAVITNIGRVYQGIANYDSAIFFNRQAIALSEIPGMEEELSSALGNLGLVYKTMGDYEKALEYYTRAYEISKKMNYSVLLAVDLNNIAALYTVWGKYELASDYFRQALEIDYETGNMAQVEMTLGNLASVIQSQGYPDSALVLFKESLAIAEKLGRHGNAAVKKINIGTIFFEAGQYPEALPYFIAGTETGKQLGLRSVIAVGLQNIGATYLKLGKYEDAEANLDQALIAAMEISALPIVLKVYESQSKLYEKMGKTQIALEAYRNYARVKDSIFTERSQTQLAEMEVRFETEKKQQHIELLIKDNQLHEAELKRKQIALIGLSAGVLILLIASLLITILFAQKSKANRKLVEKNLELMKQEEEEHKPITTESIHSTINDEEKERILTDLDRLMKTEKFFSQPQLSLADLAEKLETNTTYLSRVINEYFNTNFSNYLNKLRIREAQKMFAYHKHKSMTLEGIAGSVGFHSRSTFNTAFKKVTGVTPSIFIKNLHEITKTRNMENALQNNELP